VARTVLGIGAILVAYSCESSTPLPHRGQQVRAVCPSAGDDDFFFPEETLSPGNATRDYERRLALSSYLTAAGVASLSCGAGEDGYRLIWGGGYNDPLLVVTVSGRTVAATEFVPSNIAKRSVKNASSRTITRAQFDDVASQIESADFWTADAVRVFESEGTGWVFEGRRGTSYRAITRTHPDQRLAKVARVLVELSELSVPSRMSIQEK